MSALEILRKELNDLLKQRDFLIQMRQKYQSVDVQLSRLKTTVLTPIGCDCFISADISPEDFLFQFYNANFTQFETKSCTKEEAIAESIKKSLEIDSIVPDLDRQIAMKRMELGDLFR
jgi:hypothetical protein